MRWAGLLALALVGLGGCAAPPPCVAAAVPGFATPNVGHDFAATDARQPWDTLVLESSANHQSLWSNVTSAPSRWPAALSPLAAEPGQGPSLLRLRVQPATATSANVTMNWTTVAQDGSCRSGLNGHVRWSLASPQPGDVARAGVGVRVLTAGFFENGTLFYTNIEGVNNDTSWAHASIYSWDGGDALPVYIYDQDRGERSGVWSATTGGTPLGPATGNMTAWNYFTTIRGFNEALKGLSTNTVRVVRLAPEDAYTDVNHTSHPLFGLPLVFLIKIVSVEEIPCADGGGPCARVPSMQRLPFASSPSGAPVFPAR